jgi:hypothetical protein
LSFNISRVRIIKDGIGDVGRVHFASLFTRHFYTETWFQTWFYGFPRKICCGATIGNSCSKAYIFLFYEKTRIKAGEIF